MDNEYSNNEPQALRQKSQNFYPDGYYICTGVPGNGFYSYYLNGVYPVPVGYAEKYLVVESKTKETIVDNPEKTDMTVNRAIGEFVILCVLYTVFAKVMIYFFEYLAVYPLWIIAGLGLFGPKLLFDILHATAPATITKTEDYIDVTFNEPDIETGNEYYVSKARNLLGNLPDGVSKDIITHYQNCLQEPDMSKSNHVESDFEDLRKVFCDLMLATHVLGLKYCDNELAREPEVIVFDASIYLGVFDFLSPFSGVPVFDFGEFRIYLYPQYAIKAYDEFAFEVFQYGDVSVDMGNINYCYPVASSPLLTRIGYGKNLKDNLYKFTRVSIILSGTRYSVLLSNNKLAGDFAERLRGYVENVS